MAAILEVIGMATRTDSVLVNMSVTYTLKCHVICYGMLM